MKANQLLLAAILVGAIGAPIGTSAEEKTMAQQMTPARAQLPIEGELPSLGGATGWLNSPPLTPDGLRGKVVLIDIWTYTCINWLRTLPYVRAWAEKYKDQGLVVIGVHSPEFAFEKNVDNVRRAAKDMRVDYPIAIDSDYAIWRALKNEYWPALYIVDAQGRIRHHQFGEGEYEQSERIIQQLLAEAGNSGIGRDLVSVDARGAEAAADWGNLKSPENYVGYERTENFASPGGAVLDKPRVYAAPARLKLNQWALSGDWTMRETGHRARTSPTGGSRTAFTPAISISSWDLRRQGLPCAFACSSMENRRALLTESTSTTRATARSPSSGCIS